MRAYIKKSELMKKLGAFKSVHNTESRNGWGSAPNQFELCFANGKVFQSYDTFIGAVINGVYYFTDYHSYSNTTSSHCTRWCGYNSNERRKKLESGEMISILGC